MEGRAELWREGGVCGVASVTSEESTVLDIAPFGNSIARLCSRMFLQINLSWFCPLPCIAFEIRVAPELVAQAFCVLDLVVCGLDTNFAV